MDQVAADAEPVLLVFHNDDKTPFDFVVELFREVFGRHERDAYALATLVNRQGKVACGPYPSSVAKALLDAAQERIREEEFPLVITREADEETDVFRRGVPTSIGAGVPWVQLNEINGLEGSPWRRWGSFFDQHSHSGFGFLHMVKRSGNDSILAEQLGLRKDIPRQMFQQLIAKASADVRRKLERERPDLVDQIQTSVSEVAGSLQSKFGPATTSYFAARRSVTSRHQFGELNEKSILEYALAHKIEETTIGLSLLCSLPVAVVERALTDREMTLILAKARGFAWETAMSLLFLGAKDHRVNARDLDRMKEDFARLNAKTSKEVLDFYQSRKQAMAVQSEQRRLPQLHSM